jgi:hypothetical protein
MYRPSLTEIANEVFEASSYWSVTVPVDSSSAVIFTRAVPSRAPEERVRTSTKRPG